MTRTYTWPCSKVLWINFYAKNVWKSPRATWRKRKRTKKRDFRDLGTWLLNGGKTIKVGFFPVFFLVEKTDEVFNEFRETVLNDKINNVVFFFSTCSYWKGKARFAWKKIRIFRRLKIVLSCLLDSLKNELTFGVFGMSDYQLNNIKKKYMGTVWVHMISARMPRHKWRGGIAAFFLQNIW